MNLSALRLLYQHELRVLLRGRRTIVMSIVLPAIIMPLMLLGSRYSQEQRERRLDNTLYRYAVVGPMADHTQALVEQTRLTDEFRDVKFEKVESSDPRASLDKNEIAFYLQTLDPADADWSHENAKRLKGVPVVQIVYRSTDISENGSKEMLKLLNAAQRRNSTQMLIERGFSIEQISQFTVDKRSVATDAQLTGANIGRFITVFLVMLLFTGGSVAAMDIIAGEKERGTLETLLTSAASRVSIVTSKQLAICTVAFTITLIQALNFLIYIQLRIVKLPANFSLDISSFGVAALIALFIPLAAAIAAVLLIISAYAKTYKEAQLHFFPAYALGIAPALASFLPGLKLRSAIVLVPIANVSVAVREILMNRADPAMVIVAVIAMSTTAVLLMRFSARLLVREDIVVAAHAETAIFIGGDELFRRRVARWFVVMWALVFLLAANISWFQSFRAQVLFNEIGVFLGASAMMIYFYKLDLKKTLSLRKFAWPVLLAIPIGIPSGYITTVGLMKLANFFIPAPEELMRQFSNQTAPADMPMWQLYLLVAITPAICEEIAFRGILLRGLRKRFKPVARAIVVGLVFGVFHYSLFRIVPTAFLGIILTAIAMTTGSIFPGMLFHAGNNAFAIWSGAHDFSFDALEWPQFAAASFVFALSLWIIYRSRSTYES